MSALLRIGAGLIAWALAFTTVYGLQGLGCALGWQLQRLGPFDALRAILVLAWLAFLAAASLIAVRSARRATTGVTARLETGIAVVGVAAIAYTLFPVAWMAPCG